MRFELIVFVLLIGVSRASSPNSLASKWSTLEIAIRSRFSTAFDQTLADNLASFLNQTFERTISSSCKDSLIDLVNSLRAMDLWAVKSEFLEFLKRFDTHFKIQMLSITLAELLEPIRMTEETPKLSEVD